MMYHAKIELDGDERGLKEHVFYQWYLEILPDVEYDL